MHTLGFRFKPGPTRSSLADGPAILDYVRETATESGVDDKIRYEHRVVSAAWSTADARWTVEAERTDTGERVQLTCGFLFMCSGYYRYDEGYTPEFPGIDASAARSSIPSTGPRTSTTPASASSSSAAARPPSPWCRRWPRPPAHVTMLQRSPTYVVSIPGEDPIANLVRRVLPVKAAYAIVRWKNVLLQMARLPAQPPPAEVRQEADPEGHDQRALPQGYDVDRHFKPKYDPWDQRMCAIPDGDLFEAISDGSAEIVTDRIETFTEKGIELESGDELEADIVITATGLNLLFLGGIEVSLDGEPSSTSRQAMTYKGMMLSEVPNLAFTLGYSNASWTLKADLTSEYVCRLLNHMDEHGYAQCVPRARGLAPSDDPIVELSSGYVLRAIDHLPKQGPGDPWTLKMNYAERPPRPAPRRPDRQRHGVLQPGPRTPACRAGRRLSPTTRRAARLQPASRRLGGVATQRPAKPFTPVRFR